MSHISISLLILFGLVSCGKNAGGIISGGDEKPKEGITSFFTGKFSGLTFNSSSFSGVISSGGNFKCKRGEQVDFYLASLSKTYDIHVGSAPCQEVVSPINLVTWGEFGVDADINQMGFNGVGKNYQVALTRWLQIIYLLDSDQNPQNGLSFSRSKNTLFSNEISNRPFHPDQIFGNYTTSNLISSSDFILFLERVETLNNNNYLSETEVVSLLENMRHNCTSYTCTSFLF